MKLREAQKGLSAWQLFDRLQEVWTFKKSLRYDSSDGSVINAATGEVIYDGRDNTVAYTKTRFRSGKEFLQFLNKRFDPYSWVPNDLKKWFKI